MTNPCRLQLIDAADRTEDVYTLRKLVRIATDSSAELRGFLEEAQAHIRQAHALVELQKNFIDLQETIFEMMMKIPGAKE